MGPGSRLVVNVLDPYDAPMIRIVAVAVFAALVAALLLMPGVSPSRLATKQVADLLEATSPLLDEAGEPVQDEDGNVVSGPPLWEEIFASDAVTTETGADGKQSQVLRMGGIGFFPAPEIRQEGEGYDFLWAGQTGKALVRRLRAIAADKEIKIRIEAFKKPDPEGVNFAAVIDRGRMMLSCEIKEDAVVSSPLILGTPQHAPSAPFAERSGEWKPITSKSLLPPLVAIFLAILFRRPILALFSGVWVGAILMKLSSGLGFGAAALASLQSVFGTYFQNEVRDHGRLQIVLFVVFMLAMVGILTKAGGIRGIMNRIAVLARDARKTQIATWFMGLAIFFDDYANTILVGSTMRPLADKFRVAREKLAYIVDSTAAPVAGVSLLSTWIAFEVSTFSAQLPDAGLSPTDGYAIFIQTLPYRFYCWFTLIFVAFIVFSGRDFGPMLTAERRARRGKVLRDGATPLVGKAATELEASESVEPKASTALVPLALFILTTLGVIVFKGALSIGLLLEKETFPGIALGSASGSLMTIAQGILYGGSGEFPLMVGGIVGFIAASIMALLRGLPITQILGAAFNSLRAMGVALIILYLAWMVGAVCGDLGTAKYLSATLYTSTPYVILPIALFILSGLIAFSTGSSWSTMTILLPLVIGLTYDIGYAGSPDSGDAAARAFGLFLMTVSIGAVLEGAIFGDHCSPISDTTVMTSIACASDHVDHVRTQAPYALLTMAVALGIGYFPVVFLGASPYLCLIVGAVVLYTILRLKGKRAEDPAADEPVAA